MNVVVTESRGEKLFDFSIGIAVPSVLLWLEATPFSDGSGGPAKFPYLGPALKAASLAAWVLFALRTTHRGGKVADAVAGGFAGVAIVAGAAGAVLLPRVFEMSAVLDILAASIPMASTFSLARLSYRTFRSSYSGSREAFAGSLIAVVCGCSLAGYWVSINDQERAIAERILTLPEGQSLSLRSVVPGDWVNALVFGPYTTADEIDLALGFTWDSRRKRALERSEGRLLLVFASRKDVVHSVFLPLSPNPRFCISDGRMQRVRGPCPE